MHVDADKTKAALLASGGAEARKVALDAELLSKLVDVLNATLNASEGKVGLLLGWVDKHAALADIAARAGGHQGVKLASTSLQITTQTLSLMKLSAQASPGAVVATVGAMFCKKVSLAFGLVDNDKQAKLVAATADLIASTTTFGLAFAAASNPLGWIIATAAFASAGLAGYNAGTAYREL